jgi:ABC-type antimicrobial peptide transport system permease subunit
MVQDRLIALLSGFFGVLALILATLGLYGVTAHTVSRRRQEVGIRLALGSSPAEIVRLVLRRVGLPIGLGIAAGTAACLWLSRFAAPLVYGLPPRDPSTLAGAAAVLAVAAGAAAWVPAHRVSRTDPAAVLRD